MSPPLPTDALINTAIDIVHFIIRQGDLARIGFGEDETEIADPRSPNKDINNITRGIDKLAHAIAKKLLQLAFRDKIGIFSEEGKGAEEIPDSFVGIDKTIAVIDPIDGTDLYARGLSNWCSCIVFYYPPKRKILCAAVGTASGHIYYASEEGAYRKLPTDATLPHPQSERLPLTIISESKSLSDATVCFVGQKFSQLLPILENKRIHALLKEFKRLKEAPQEAKPVNFRLYNLGGNPMLPKLTDGSVDTVFETRGQKAHDYIPGAYIVQQAGLPVLSLADGQPLNLGECMLTPKAPFPYVAAVSNELANTLRALFPFRAK